MVAPKLRTMGRATSTASDAGTRLSTAEDTSAVVVQATITADPTAEVGPVPDRTMRQVSGWCAIALAVTYVVAGLLSFVVPADLRSDDPPTYWRAVLANPALAVAGFWVIALGGILGLGAIGGISALVSAAHAGLVRWAQNLAFLGFAVSAVSFARLATVTYGRGLTYFCESCTGTDNFKKIIDGTQPLVQLDPQGWFSFGAVGLWVLVISVLALRARLLPAGLAILGIALAIFYGLALASNIFGIDALFTVASSVGVLVALGWYCWIGMHLLRMR